eukprot:TRINITY_DN2595_c0_g3_i2.p1 TRINITY_DN2595_c0_g3~~TRINITY_DN2595_c0_g3_i2.p1  ORF type:complete len:246 (-),score=42.03 TRINITY_DN2595_c0_g3_i2:4-645(-)
MGMIKGNLTLRPLSLRRYSDAGLWIKREWMIEIRIGNSITQFKRGLGKEQTHFQWENESSVVPISSDTFLYVKLYQEGLIWEDVLGEVGIRLDDILLSSRRRLPFEFVKNGIHFATFLLDIEYASTGVIIPRGAFLQPEARKTWTPDQMTSRKPSVDAIPLPKPTALGHHSPKGAGGASPKIPVSYTHLRAHETPEHLVCRLLLEKKKSLKSD